MLNFMCGFYGWTLQGNDRGISGSLLEQHDYYNDTRRGKVLPIRYTSKNTDKSGNHRALRQFEKYSVSTI